MKMQAFQMKARVGVGIVLAALAASATDMEHKARTVLTCRTAFGVYFRGSGADVQNVWTSDCSVNGDGRHLRPKLWCGWCSKYHSELADNMPLAVGFNSRDVAPVAVATSEVMRPVDFGLYADDETCDVICRCEFFVRPSVPMSGYACVKW